MLMVLAAVLEVAGIGMIPVFVAIVADPERIMSVEWLAPVFSLLDITTTKDLLIWGSITLVTVFILKSGYIISLNFFESRFIYNRRYTMSYRLMSSYMRAPYTFHLQRNSAELLRNITREVDVITNIVVTYLLKMGREGIMVLAILIMLFTVEPLITFMIILLSGLGGGTFILLNKKKMQKYGQEEQRRYADMVKAVHQGFGGIKEARVLNREEEFIKIFSNEAFKSTRLMAYLKFIQQIPRPIVETTAVIGMLLISVMLVWQDRAMSDIIPILTLFAMATVRLMPSVQELISMYTNLRYSMVSINPVYEDLKALETYNARYLKNRSGNPQLQLHREIEIRNVNYRYPGSEDSALSNISLTIRRGEVVAFVGSSGAGKTTIVDLILGLLEPDEGEILVDDIDIRTNISGWQRNIGYIPQSIYLADETLQSNIAFGVPKEEIDETKIMQAVKMAQLETLIQRLPDKLNTIVGEHGVRLSGGQRQRIGIARALYHSPQVLVMDEATSALDNITERQITRAIELLKGDRTLIMIAHRLSTVRNCDTLYFMEDGKIVQKGTYSDLVDTNSRFREMALEI